jgi:hypothetical protein
MVVPEKVKDMGTVAQGAVVDIDFVISNEGTEALQIKAVRPTCGCTVADYDKEIGGRPGSVKISSTPRTSRDRSRSRS